VEPAAAPSVRAKWRKKKGKNNRGSFDSSPSTALRVVAQEDKSNKDGFEVSHPKRKDKYALRVGHPALLEN
jgi:hypothetical protein